MEHHAPSARDRLGALPDCLLHRIVSHLRTRQLVHTSLLSRRWRHVWRNAPRLDVDQREFQYSAAAATDCEREKQRFEKFAHDLVSHRGDHGGPNLSLDAFRLFVANGMCRRSSERLVSSCLQRYRPAVLDICFGSCIFLRRTSLGADLRCLTTLRLELLALDSGFEHHLSASGCPLLEHLELKYCSLAFEEVVTSRALKTMVVDRSSTSESARYHDIRPRIRTPGLASLSLHLLDYYGAWMHDMPSLVEASVRYETVSAAAAWLPRYGFEYDLLCSLYNVTRLELSGLPPLEKVTVDEDFLKFPNLTTLLLNECDLTGQVHTTMLELFLQNAPCLEKLNLQYCKLPRRSESTRISYQCMNLKLAEIKYRDEVLCLPGGRASAGRHTKDLQRISIRLSKG